ncbi:hypothetical protein Tco_0181912, partial [Tanacetum coccineum]
MVICKVGKPWGIIITTKGNHPKWSAARFSAPFFITDHDIKFLEQQNPPEQSWLSILLSEQILESRIVRIHYAFGQDKIWPEFLESIHYGETTPTAKSLASHMISKGKSQSGATRIGACVNFNLRVSNASMHSFEKINRVSFSR